MIYWILIAVAVALVWIFGVIPFKLWMNRRSWKALNTDQLQEMMAHPRHPGERAAAAEEYASRIGTSRGVR